MAGMGQGWLSESGCAELTSMSTYSARILLPHSGPSILACGAWLKNTVCITRGNEAHISPLIGDLDSIDARLLLDETVAQLCASLDVQPQIVAHDLHQDFYSTQFALAYA